MSFWVYILRCADGSYYTGHTDSLESRIAQHSSGAIPSCYTFNRRPLECVFSQDFATREETLAMEQQVKGWSRKKKEAMIRGDWAEVSRLARSSSRSEPDDERQPPVRSEPHHERQKSVRPELVEGPQVVRPFDKLTAHHERQTQGRSEPGHEGQPSLRPEPEQTPVRPEPVEGRDAKG